MVKIREIVADVRSSVTTIAVTQSLYWRRSLRRLTSRDVQLVNVLVLELDDIHFFFMIENLFDKISSVVSGGPGSSDILDPVVVPNEIDISHCLQCRASSEAWD